MKASSLYTKNYFGGVTIRKKPIYIGVHVCGGGGGGVPSEKNTIIGVHMIPLKF